MGMPLSTAEIANTMEAAPRSPAQDTTPICAAGARNGASSTATTTGRAATVRNTMIPRAGSRTAGSSTGVTSRPSRKKMMTWQTLVRTSKK